MTDNAANDLAARIDTAARALHGPQLRAVMTGLGVKAKDDMADVAKSATGGDAKLSNWTKLSSGFEFVDDATINLNPRPYGPWRVMDKGAAAHVIRPKVRRGGGRKALKIGGHLYRASVRIPRTRGKGTLTKAQALVTKNTPPRALDAISGMLRKELA